MSARRLTLGLATAGGLLVASACGDITADLESDVAPSLGAGFAARPLPPSTAVLRCPLEPPTPQHLPDGGTFDPDASPDGGPRTPSFCSPQGACELGTSADRNCNRVFSCDGTHWTELPSYACHERVCPSARAAMAELDGRPCDLGPSLAAEALCNVADGVCACSTGAGGSDLHDRRWVCAAPLLRECPLERPLIGSACEGATFCDYGACRTKRGFALECHRGAWRAVPAEC
ncbi:MAG: hypothetical protein KIT84_07200 [Labilithrix sp.]|nr:hypothetical protein [Labilithrix sp.]MCW5810781.1 hypothetical protein [Labilithrix sp.]